MKNNPIRLMTTAIALVLIVAACGNTTGTNNGPEEPSPTSTVAAVPTTVTTEAEPGYTKAQATLDDWAVAIGASDVDAAVATLLTEPGDLEAVWEATAYLASTSSNAEFSNCEFSIVPAGHILADCQLTLSDPILEALDKQTVPVTWALSYDGRTILRWEPGFRASTEPLFIPYAQEHYPEAFETACGEGTANYNQYVGFAFNRACGEFTAAIADEVLGLVKSAG